MTMKTPHPRIAYCRAGDHFSRYLTTTCMRDHDGDPACETIETCGDDWHGRTDPDKQHARDEDCDVDPETDTCRVLACQVYHGDPCSVCGGRGFHHDGCPESDTDCKNCGTVEHGTGYACPCACHAEYALTPDPAHEYDPEQLNDHNA